MGAVDLVIQVESPKSVAAACSASARGHELHARLEGPDLPEVPRRPARVAVVARRCARRDRGDAIPRNPLDVLAQQIVAIAATRRSGRRAARARAPRATRSPTSRAQLENVLDMLAGPLPVDEFAELRPRIVWDRTGGRSAARRRAAARGHERGHDPDRGLFGVFLVDGGGRVGELDEEMVYEARAGRRSCSARRRGGSRRSRATACSSRRRRGCRAGAVLEGRGRRPPVRARARRSAPPRASSSALGDDARARLREEYLLDERAARNLLTFLREQADATGAVPVRPHDRGRELPRRDRATGACCVSPVRRPRARAVGDGDRGAPCAESLGSTAASRLVGRRIALTFPAADSGPPPAGSCSSSRRGEDLVVAELGQPAALSARAP
jgi:ATP-dependent Lhr-like helicase